MFTQPASALPSPPPIRATRAYGGSVKATEYDVGDFETLDGARLQTALGFLDTAASSPDPFFLAVGFQLPHLPWGAPSRFFDLYDLANISIPSEPDISLQGYPKYSIFPTWIGSRPVEETRSRRRDYYASVSYVDFLLGELMAKVEALGIRDNTIIVFMGDHGFSLGEHNRVMWEKWNAFEEAIKTPLFISAPGVTPGNCFSVVGLIDLFPTFCDVTGTSLPDQVMHGRSIVPLLADPALTWPYPALTSVRNKSPHWQVARTKEWKYARSTNPKRVLIDCASDPQEVNNLAENGSSVTYAPIMDQMNDLFPPEWSASLQLGHRWSTTSVPDRDGDGILDHDELDLGTWPHLADTDSDGVDDGAEQAIGFSPLISNLEQFDAIRAHAGVLDLYREDQIIAGSPDLTIKRDEITGKFHLDLTLARGTDLQNWTPFWQESIEISDETDAEFFRFELR